MTNDDILVLCEGASDWRFIKKLLSSLGFGDRISTHEKLANEERCGRDNIRNLFRQKVIATSRTDLTYRYILIFLDSGEDSTKTFDSVIEKLQEELDAWTSNPGVRLPSKPDVLSDSDANCPAVAVVMLPRAGEKGGLESLYVAALKEKLNGNKKIASVPCIFQKNIDIESCYKNFIDCIGVSQSGWNREKLDKSLFHAVIAATNKGDPGGWAFEKLGLDLDCSAFSELKSRLNAILSGI